MFKDELKQYVKNHPKLVKMRPAGDGIYVLKYSKSVFYDGLWNRYLEECRGTIVDEDFNIVSYPFTKIYNYGVEKQAPVFADDTKVTAFRKVNGFMVALTFYKGDVLVSTTGSTDSDYVKMALELIDVDRYRKVCSEWYNTTFMFECVHRNDPHIIPETEGMYLLGYRAKSWDISPVNPDPKLLRMLAVEFGTLPVEHTVTTVGELLEEVKKVRHEGFVAYTYDGTSFKIKSPFYLTNKWIARNPRTEKLMREDFKKQIDEEYYPLLSAIQADIEAYTAKTEQERLAWIREFLS